MKRVYFIRPIGMEGPIKIGCSQSPDGRRDTLEAWSPFPLEIVAELDGDFGLERKFHRAFHHLHQSREWFRAGPELLAVISAIQAGTFDPASLPDEGDKISALWRARRPSPDWTGKQVGLTRKVHLAEWFSGFRCPVEIQGAYREGRHDDIALAKKFAENPSEFGKHDPEMYWVGQRFGERA